MISIEQIRVLEAKVHTAVERIQALNAENTTLRSKLSEYENRVADLQKRVESFQSDQAAIEAGILSALSQLDTLEDRIGSDSPADDASDTPTPPQEHSVQADHPGVDETAEPAGTALVPEETEDESEDPELDIF